MATARPRDYRLGGIAEERAIAAGLAEAEWYRAPIDPARLAELARRSNRQAAIHVGVYFTLLIASGLVAYATLWSWWSIPALFVYGTLYGSAADSRWHECGHRTAFRSDILNDLVYYAASFMMLRDPTVWRWSHVRHHSDTIVVGRDPEVVLERPPRFGQWLVGLFALKHGPQLMARTVRHAVGRIGPDVRSYVPERELSKVVWEARVNLGLWGGVIVWCIGAQSFVPLVFFVGPSFYGGWLAHVLAATQHLGLREDVLDHRLNTRTMYVNPVLRFLYWNMNYHCEHHMFPTVPSRNLASLHQEVRMYLPPPNASLASAYREVLFALRQQSRDPNWELPREVPTMADRVQSDTGGERVIEVVAADEDGWIDVCGVGQLRDGDVARADHGTDSIAVYCLGDDYFASDGICTHGRRVHLAGGIVIDGQIECPKHNGRFDIRTGEPTRAPVTQPLRTRQTRIVGDRVWVRKESDGEL